MPVIVRWLLIVGAVAACSLPTLATGSPWDRFKRGELVLLIRHALAPGNGDPAEFQLRNCATQRNLNIEGRTQARSIGRWLNAQGIHNARVWSSQWCRCLDTARLFGLGSVQELVGLNSFYEMPDSRASNLRQLKSFLNTVQSDGGPIILVTHFVTISATTGVGVGSGEGVLAVRNADGDLTHVATVTFGPSP